MGFFDYLNAQNNNSVATMDEEKMITIRRIFKIDPKVQKELGKEPSESDKEQTSAEDQAIFVGGIAMDLSPRHSKTPIEKCRAKDPRYCPYHGADFMTAQLNEAFKKKGIYAAGAVERMSQGKFKIQYSVPESKRDAANAVIDEFLTSPGFVELDEKKDDKIIDKIDKEMGEDVGKGFKMDRPNDEFALKEEHLDTLEEDMNKGMNIDPSELYQLRKDHHELKKIAKAAYEAAEEEGIDASSGTKEVREWKEMSPDWQKYREARAKYEKDYNAIRGNADLAHIESVEDCKELMDHLEKQITQIGDFVKETDEIAAIKAAKGMTGKRKIGDRKIEGTTAFNDAKGAIRFTIDGLKSARKQVEEAKESGDIKKMRAAAHSLELVLHEVGEKKDEIAHALEQARSYKAHLLTFPGPDGLEKPAEKKEEPSASEKKEEKPEAPAKKEDPKTEEKKSEPAEKPAEEKKEEPKGESKKMTDDEYKEFFAGKQDHIKDLMKKAGFEEALELKKKIEEEEGKDIFDISGLGDEASECFQTGLYEVWEGKGVDDMLSIVKDFPDCEGDAESVIKTYEDAIDGIKKFIPKAKMHLEASTGSKKDEYGFSGKDYEEVVDKFLKKHKGEKAASETSDHDRKLYTGTISEFMDKAGKGSISLAPADGGKTSNDMQFLKDIREAVGSDHPYVKKMDEYVSGLKDSFKELMAMQEEASGEPTKPADYASYLKTKDGEEEIKRVAEGWSNPAGTFKANPRLAECLKQAAKAPKSQAILDIAGLMGMSADDLKAGSSSAGSSSASKPEKPAAPKSAAAEYLDGVFKDKFIKRYGADRFEKIDKLASKAMAEGKTAIGRSGWDDYEDADEDRYQSIKSLVRKMGGTIEGEGGGEEENERYFHFSGIPPEKMHELYAKIDARGGMLPW